MSKTPVFRKQIIQDANGAQVSLTYRPIKQLFKWGTQPYVILGTSGFGKTTIAIDIVAQFANEATNIYYVTATKPTITDDAISYIPKAWRKTPSFNDLKSIWMEMTTANEAANMRTEHLERLLVALIGEQKAKPYFDQLQHERSNILNERREHYAKKNINADDINKMAAADGTAFYFDALTRMCVSFAKTVNTNTLGSEDISTLRALHSKKPKTILILDDVSSELEAMKTNKTKVIYNGQQKLVKDAYNEMLMDILTRARHYDCIVCMFLHSVSILSRKELIKNIIVLDNQMVNTIKQTRNISDNVKAPLQAAASYVFVEAWRYHFLYISTDTSVTNPEVFVCKAELHAEGEELNINPLMKNLLEAYDNIDRGMRAKDDDNVDNGEIGMTFDADSDEDSMSDVEVVGDNFIGSFM